MDKGILYLENLRKRAAIRLMIIIAISIVVSLICLFFFLQEGLGYGVYASIFLGFGLGYLLTKVTGYHELSEEFKNRYKATFVEIPMKEAFTDVVYYGDDGIDEGAIEATGIMKMGNRYASNDFVRGYYKDVRFQRADVTIEEHHSTGKSSYTITLLKGRWLIFEFNKDFHFDLQIIGKGFSHSRKHNSIFTIDEERRHRIKLEDIEFNEIFDVFCQNEHEAYYILTPRFMSMLKEINNTVDGSIMLGFVDNQLHIAIHNDNDAMEPKIFDKIDLSAVKMEVQNEINIITSIIDNLGLDQAIYNS